jgi:hypothetical protein
MLWEWMGCLCSEIPVVAGLSSCHELHHDVLGNPIADLGDKHILDVVPRGSWYHVAVQISALGLKCLSARELHRRAAFRTDKAVRTSRTGYPDPVSALVEVLALVLVETRPTHIDEFQGCSCSSKGWVMGYRCRSV